jgi:hypothetical protein
LTANAKYDTIESKLSGTSFGKQVEKYLLTANTGPATLESNKLKSDKFFEQPTKNSS